MIIKKIKYNKNINPTLTVQNDDAVISINLNPFLKSSSETIKNEKIVTMEYYFYTFNLK